jgi:hypothetical protein
LAIQEKMNERSAEALVAALAMLQRPQLCRAAQRSALPRGVTLLLKVAAGEHDALREAITITGRPEALLKKAAGFFVEQVLLTRTSDSYRILGTSNNASAGELRRHMALLLKWLHPDGVPGSRDGGHFDKTALVSLVTAAWETIKTEDRRRAYDAALKMEAKDTRAEAFRIPQSALTAPTPRPSIRGSRSRHLALYRIEREPLWIRLLSYLGRMK